MPTPDASTPIGTTGLRKSLSESPVWAGQSGVLNIA